jgi:hypothetical protein
VGKGSTFYFELAKSADADRRLVEQAGLSMWHECAPSDDTANLRTPRAMTELKTILHVDDDEDILEITRMALQLVDTFELHQCSSGPRR